MEEKERHMVAWWEGNMELFKNIGIKHEDFGRMVLESRLLFRYGIVELLSHCHRMKLPIFIVSGGISEIIEASFFAILHNGETKDAELADFWHKRV
jgi:2-hydroxy-3-keto-5-methylthiopentenyl-1-phosphate phosphatase